jgi:hypothetical protein
MAARHGRAAWKLPVVEWVLVDCLIYGGFLGFRGDTL